MPGTRAEHRARQHRGLRRALALLCALLSMVAPAPAVAPKPAVDTALVLAIDGSASAGNTPDFATQIRGHARALTHADVLAAIKSGRAGRVAVTAMVWSGPDQQDQCVPWRVVSGAASAERAAAWLLGACRARAGPTAIGPALEFAAALFQKLPYDAGRKVVDLSASSAANMGRIGAVTAARDAAVGDGIVVNGLAIEHYGGLRPPQAPAPMSLVRYFESFVIGGRGAFAVAATHETYTRALVRKLLRELSVVEGSPRRTAARRGDHE